MHNVAAIVVSYQPTAALPEQVRALAPQVSRVFIVDNGSGEVARGLLADLVSANVEVLAMGDNVGIACAQNRGLQHARAHGATHVLLMDQDSWPEPQMVERLVAAWEHLAAKGERVACVGPRVRMSDGTLSGFYRLRGLWPRPVACATGASTVECDSLIASGSLIPLAALEEVGAMEEGLFIDVVDEEWCLRARSRGHRVYGVCDASLRHRLGESSRYIWLGRWRQLPRHKPFRYYYIFRNTLAVGRRSYVPLRWKLFQLVRLTALFLSYGLLTRDRGGEVAYMLKGVAHGLRGVSGRQTAP